MGTATTVKVERWITKKEAAEVLGLSTRAVERLAQSRGITMRHEKPGPGRRYSMVFYSSPEIEALRDERRDGVRSISTAVTRTYSAIPPDAQIAIARAQIGIFEGLTAHLAPSRAPKPWLTFDEAVEYSGLAPSMLEEVLRQGDVFSIGRGLKTWRIQRASLDAWSTEPKQ